VRRETSTQAECVLAVPALLGESPVWCQTDQVLYWVDIKKPALHRFNPLNGTSETWPMPEDIGCLGLRQSGGAIVALRSGFAYVDFRTGEVRKAASPELKAPADMRFNDGRCDRRGRFWAGTLHERRDPGTASLYRFDPGGGCTQMVEGVTISNGISWSPDSRTMYFADSWQRTIFHFDFEPDSGTPYNQRVFAELPSGSGVPDGATVDSEGFLWSANFDGGCITRYAPNGSVDRVIQMPIQRPTSCAFGGQDLTVLYVTSASINLTEEQRAAAPLAGGLFAIDVGVKGLPEPRFAG
jgi:L-arabinonolactonase